MNSLTICEMVSDVFVASTKPYEQWVDEKYLQFCQVKVQLPLNFRDNEIMLMCSFSHLHWTPISHSNEAWGL